MYTGTAGTSITLGVFQGATQQTASYVWTVTGMSTVPSSGTGSTFQFTPLEPGTVTVTNISLPASISIVIVADLSLKWVVPGLGFAAGVLPGSFYVSDVVIQNPSTTQPMSLSLALADGTAPAQIAWRAITLSPMESRIYVNILPNLFGMTAGRPATALVVRGDVLPTNAMPVIWAFTYNNNGGDPTKGTSGVAIPAVPLPAAVSSDSPVVLTEIPGLRDVPDYPSQSPDVSYPNVPPAYTNVGFVNTGDNPATLKVNFFSARAATRYQKLGQEISLLLAPNETRQITQVLSKAASGGGAGWDIIRNPEDNYVMTVSVAADGKVVPYASVKDIGSSDSIFLTNDGSIASNYRVPAVVRANGQFGAVFRSRLVVFNPSDRTRTVRFSLSFLRCLAGTTTCDPRQIVAGNFALLSGSAVIYEDFVKEWLTKNYVAVPDDRDYTTSFVDVSPADLNIDPLFVRAETYNATPTGNFGTQVPGFVASVHGASADPGGPGSRLLLPRAVPNGGAGGFRTNVAIVLLSGATGAANVRLYRDSGGSPVLPEVSLTLSAAEPFLQRSLENLFPAITSFPAGSNCSIEIRVTDGTIGAYVSINDNVTGDSSVIVARPQQ